MNPRPLLTTIAALAAVCLGGCDRQEIRVYTVAKEAAAPVGATGQERPTPAANAARPQLAYTLPAGWQDAGATSMSLANFRIKTDAGEASVNITPLGNMAGQEAAIVNMWREQVGQPSLGESDMADALTPVEIGGEKGRLFEITGTRAGETVRIVTAFAHRGGASWFYKLQGSEAAVAAQKPAFVEFLKTVRIKEDGASVTTVADTAPATPAAPAAPAAPEFKWKVPEGWQTLPAGQMQVAKFAVPARDAAKAEVFVSVFPSESGGTLANVNRWRRQIGLDPVDEEGLKPLVSPIEGAPGAQLVDLKNEAKAMLGAIVPREGRWWFYKLMGDTPAVTAERDAFVRFVQTAP